MTSVDERTIHVDPELKKMRKIAVALVLIALFFMVPLLAIAGIVEPQTVNKLGRYLCFAICAIGIDILWGYTGILGLCQALFFCLGGYAMAMFLSLPGGGGDVRPEYNDIPQFFFFNNITELPFFWEPFSNFPVMLIMAIAIPSIVAMIIGYVVFSSRVKGVYFTIITQAIAWGAYLAFCRNEMLLGGTNGLTNFYKPLNQDTGWIIGLYLLTAAVLTLIFLGSRFITSSRLGRLLVSIRDKEMLLNFIGYKPYMLKMFAFVLAAAIAGIGGMLYVPQNGIITPNIMRVEDSIWMVIWVALGGRGHLWGAIFGALITNLAFSSLTSDLPQVWPFIQGGMFLLVVLLFPDGFVGLWGKLEKEFIYNKKGLLYGALFVGYTILIGILVKVGLLSFEVVEKSAIAALIKYAVIYIPFIYFLYKAPSYITASIAVIASFFLMTGLDLIPDDTMYSLFDVQVKYYFLAGLLSLFAIIPNRNNIQKSITNLFAQRRAA
ncbi:MAG: urea ABC transporter permease subunit UrtC [Fibrobacterales bacterium]